MDILNTLGRLHLLILHLPIGILGLCALLETIARWQNRTDWQVILHKIWFWGMVSAVVSAFFGWLLSGRGDYDPQLMYWHRYLGFSAAALAVLAWYLRTTKWYLPSVLACNLFLVGAGHFGGSVTHGEGYLSAPSKIAAKPDTVATPRQDDIAYKVLIKPIFEKKCVSCHGSGKSKGNLRLDIPEHIAKGGKNGPVLLGGQPEKSEIYRRILLPTNDEKHMPPRSKQQVSDDELLVLKWWIQEGADFNKKIDQMNLSDEVKSMFGKK